MKTRKLIAIIVAFVCSLFVFESKPVYARELVVEQSVVDIFDSPIGIVQIYDNSEIIIGYKYGLRKVVLNYCIKGEDCDRNIYNSVVIMESNEITTYKNDSNVFATYSYTFTTDEEFEYRYKVEAYFGQSSNYSGRESINSLTKCSVDTGENYVNGSYSNEIKNNKIAKLMDDIKEITNTIILPIIYIGLGLLLIVKGAILGFQIVKSADDSYVRKEKIGALKWLVIGVAVAYLASAVVGVVTGFFKDYF